jgi:hypothetical protein
MKIGEGEHVEPKCPDHPDAKVLKARNPTTYEGRWVCSACGKNLGNAGPMYPPDWEPFEVTPPGKD